MCLGTFMLLIDVTIVNVARPDMARGLQTSFSSLQWVVDAYALALAALLLGVGSIADLIGAARAVQGIGAAAMFALLNSSYQRRDRGTGYGLWGAVSGASAAIGPVVGGLLTEGLSWRWIFFVNLPVSVLAIALCRKVLSRDGPSHEQRIDLVGMALFTVAAASVTFGLIRASDDGWSSPSCYGLLVLSAVALGAFVLAESRNRLAMLDLTFLVAGIGGILAGVIVLVLVRPARSTDPIVAESAAVPA